MTLAEKNLDYHMHIVNLFNNEQYHPEYLKLNPKGVVPTLVDDGKVIIESTLICEYLDETCPAPPLMPATPHERAKARPSAVETIANRLPTEVIADMGHFGGQVRARVAQRRQEYLEMMS
jgi:glutathione S-transferase